MVGLLFLGLFVGFLVLLPVLFLFVLLRVVLGLALLPLKIAGGLAKVLLGLFVGILALLAAVFALVLVPLLPIVFLIGTVWILLRLLRRRPS